jgi:hypothetical protein
VTLDGVMEGPGRAEEDTRVGFTRGGWGSAHADDVALSAVYARVAEGGGGLRLLLGRFTYEDMLGYWTRRRALFKDALNNAPRRLFAGDDPPAHWCLVESKPTTRGVLIATYQAAT